MKTRRLCAYPKDVTVITGKSERTAREIFKNARRHFKKKKHQFLTFRELAEYLGIPPEELDDR